MSNELALKTIQELSSLIKSGEVSPVELTDAVLNRADELNPKVNAYISVDREKAQLAAKQAEDEIRSDRYKGPLHGIPVALKDMFTFEDRVRTMGSNIHSAHPDGFDATVVKKLKEAGAVFTGTLNMTEYAFSGTSNPQLGICRNPWNLDYFPGGSSSGSGAALAADMVIASVGSDTGGSIRTPAAWCGVVGLKPTYGRVSKYGAYPLSWTYDHLGPMTKSVADAAIVLETISGYDINDPSTIDEPVPEYSELLSEDIQGLVIGINEEHYFNNIDPEVEDTVRRAIKELEAMGAVIKPVNLPYVEYTNFVEMVSAFSEAATVHQKNLKNRFDDYGDDIRMNLLFGHLFSSSDYTMAQQLRRKIIESFEKAFQEVDVLVAPSTPIQVPSLEQRKIMITESDVPNLKDRGTKLASPANAAGLPSMSIPCGFISGMPVGMQLIGKPFHEKDILKVGYAYERANPVKNKPNI